MTESRVAVVTGGTGGLGRALVPLLADRGYRIAVTYLVPDEATAMEDDLLLDEDRLMLRRVDCTDPEAVTDFFKSVAEQFGRIDVLAALVGGWAGGRDLEETDDVRFERMIDLNLRSSFYTVRAAIPHVKDVPAGRIILVGSRAAKDTPAGQAAFNIAKAGVVALTTSVAQELVGTNVTCNIVLPSVIDTAASRAALPYADYMGWPKPADIASVITFLASEESAAIDGAAIPAYGG